jgi:hypothetical protein
MPPLDYAKPPAPVSRWARLILPFAAALTLLLIAVPVGYITARVVHTRTESRKFHAAFPEPQILGQSLTQVRARFGQPDHAERRDDGTTSLTYASKTTWEYCGIEFKEDKATKVIFWGK